MKPVGAAGLIYFDNSCSGRPQWWLESKLTRSITVASRMQTQIYQDPNTKFGVELFLEGNQPASSVVYNNIGGLTLTGENAVRAGTGDVVFFQCPD